MPLHYLYPLDGRDYLWGPNPTPLVWMNRATNMSINSKEIRALHPVFSYPYPASVMESPSLQEDATYCIITKRKFLKKNIGRMDE